jgi:uncharacterized protein
MTRSLTQIQDWILSHRFLSMFLAIGFSLALASGVPRLGFSTDYRDFFGEDNPQLLAFEALQNVYSKDDNVLIAIENSKGDIFDQRTLQLVHELTRESWEIPHSTRVDSITNFQHTVGTEDELIVTDLVEDPSTLQSEDLSRIKSVALKEPLLIHRLVNEKASLTAINVTIELPGKELNEVPEVAAHVRALRDKYEERYPGMDLHLTGMVMLNNAFAESGQTDMATLTPVMFAIILGILVMITRSIGGTIATLGVIILSTLGAMGIAGYMGVKLTPPSMTSTTVIMTLAVADCVHIVLSVLQNLRHGMVKREAIRGAIRLNFLPVLITSITTAIGFLSLNFSDTPPYHDYGNITAIGVTLACVLSLTFLPAILLLLPLKPSKKPSDELTVFGKLGEWVIEKRKMLLFVMPVAIVGLILGIQRLQLNDQFVNYFDTSTEFRRETDAVMAKLTGIYNMSFPLETDLDGGVANPRYLEMAEAFSNYLRTEEDVIHVNSITDTFKRLNKSMNGEKEEFYTLPKEGDLSAQYLLLYEMSLPFGLDLNSTINLDKTSSKIVATLRNTTTVRLRDLEDRANAWVQENGEGVIKGLATSPSVMFSHISKRNIDSMITGTVISMSIITIIMILAMGSIKYGILSLIPNLVPVLMTFGFWGYFEGMVDMGVATIAGLTLGIVVDDTVHFMIKYLRARREDHSSPHTAIVSAFERVGPALAMTSITLVAGFSVMTLSTFRMNWTMGLMSAVTIAFALIVDLFLLPPLLHALDGKSRVQENSNPAVSS